MTFTVAPTASGTSSPAPDSPVSAAQNLADLERRWTALKEAGVALAKAHSESKNALSASPVATALRASTLAAARARFIELQLLWDQAWAHSTASAHKRSSPSTMPRPNLMSFPSSQAEFAHLNAAPVQQSDRNLPIFSAVSHIELVALNSKNLEMCGVGFEVAVRRRADTKICNSIFYFPRSLKSASVAGHDRPFPPIPWLDWRHVKTHVKRSSLLPGRLSVLSLSMIRCLATYYGMVIPLDNALSSSTDYQQHPSRFMFEQIPVQVLFNTFAAQSNLMAMLIKFIPAAASLNTTCKQAVPVVCLSRSTPYLELSFVPSHGLTVSAGAAFGNFPLGVFSPFYLSVPRGWSALCTFLSGATQIVDVDNPIAGSNTVYPSSELVQIELFNSSFGPVSSGTSTRRGNLYGPQRAYSDFTGRAKKSVAKKGKKAAAKKPVAKKGKKAVAKKASAKGMVKWAIAQKKAVAKKAAAGKSIVRLQVAVQRTEKILKAAEHRAKQAQTANARRAAAKRIAAARNALTVAKNALDLAQLSSDDFQRGADEFAKTSNASEQLVPDNNRAVATSTSLVKHMDPVTAELFEYELRLQQRNQLVQVRAAVYVKIVSAILQCFSCVGVYVNEHYVLRN